MTTLVIADACVLLRLKHVGALDTLKLIRRRLTWDIAITKRVAEEVSGEVSSSDFISLGVTILPSGLGTAAQVKLFRDCHHISRGVSETDAGILLEGMLDKRILWSDDKAIHREAERLRIECQWMFTPFVRLVEIGAISADYVRGLGAKAHDMDHRFTKIDLERLKNRLEKAERQENSRSTM